MNIQGIPREHLLRYCRQALNFFLAFIYSGGFLFIFPFSPLLLYSCYPIIIGLSIACTLLDRRTAISVRSIIPYVYWILLYACFGTLISPISDVVLGDVLRMVVRNIMLIYAVSTVIVDEDSFISLSRWIQITVILNAGIMMWQSFNPDFIAVITQTRNKFDTAWSADRPAGLLVNPDETSFAFLFAILISYKDKSVLAWLGRIGTVIGIYLTASRTGAYILVFYGLVFSFLFFKEKAFNLRYITIAGNSIVVLAAILLGLYSYFGLPKSFINDNAALTRILDVQENSSEGGYARAEVTAAALQLAQNSPLQGSGIFAFQEPQNMPVTSQRVHSRLRLLNLGTHNIFIAILGEVGSFGFFLYLAMMSVSFPYVLKRNATSKERIVISLLWFTYIVIGFTWHNQLTSLSGMIYIGLLCTFPAMKRDQEMQIGRPLAAYSLY